MFRMFPWSNLHDLNLDWIVSKIKNVEDAEKRTEEYAYNASQSASQASLDASSAQISATNASISASNAEQSAQSIPQALEELELTNARLDTIIPDGQQTEGNTELIDIRTGYDGTNYNTAGSAVRGQFADIAKRGNFTMPTTDFTLGAIDAQGKNVDSTARTRTEKYYRASAGDIIRLNDNNINYAVYEYDMDKNLIYHHDGWLKAYNYTVTQDCLIRIMQQTANPATLSFNRKLDIRDTSLSDLGFSATELMRRYADVSIIDESTYDLMNVALDANGYDYALNSTGRRSTPYIPCVAGDQFSRVASGTYAYNIFFYNSNKEFISKGAETGSWVTSQRVVIAPENASYARIMQNTASTSDWAGYYHFQEFKLEKNALNAHALYQLYKPIRWDCTYMINGSHRGYMAEAPQSTRPAYIIAKNKGYNTIEGDIRITSDGQFVIHHNAGMPSDASYLIADHTLAELRANANMGAYKGVEQSIMTLEELLDLAKCLDMRLYLEFKVTPSDSQYADIIQLVTNKGMIERVWFMVVNTATADKLRATNSVARLAWISATVEEASTIATYNLNHILDNQVYRRCDIFTSQFVSAFNSVGVSCVGWSVDWQWMYGSGYAIEQVKADIVNAIKNGALGIVTDIFTLEDLMKESYLL